MLGTASMPWPETTVHESSVHADTPRLHLAPHPDAHCLWLHGGPNPEALLLAHQLVEEEGLSRVELPDNSHDSNCTVDVVEVFHIVTDQLQPLVVEGVRVD